MTTKRVIRLCIGILLAIFFIWLLVRQVSLSELKHAFHNTSMPWIIAGLFAFAIGYSCRIERWRLMLLCDNTNLKWGHCAGPFFISFAANNVLPFRAGDVLRTFAFNERLGVSSGIVVATLFAERLLDLFMVVLLLGFALFIFELDITQFTNIGVSVFFFITVSIFILLLFPKLFAPFAQGIGILAERVSPVAGKRFRTEICKSLVTLEHLSRGDTMIKLVGWSLAAWLAEGCVFWFTAMAVPSIAIPLAGWLALPVGTLATLIPGTPGYIGTFDYFTVQAMNVSGNTIIASTAYALLVHLIIWIPPTIIGGLYLLLQPVKKIAKDSLV